MALNSEEIKGRLVEFAATWANYSGSERSEAQTYLNELLACFGTDRRVVATFEEPTEGRFVDMVWPEICLVEMKRPSEARNIRRHYAQAVEYWKTLGTPQRPTPRYVVVCAFDRFEVFEPGRVYDTPLASFSLVDLPDQLESLLFLAGREPIFMGGQSRLSKEAAKLVTGVAESLKRRDAAEDDEIRHFMLQSVWCLFAEDLRLLPDYRFTAIVDDLIRDQRRSSADDLAQLFHWLSTPGDRPSEGMYADVPYANGGLFAEPARVHLNKDELERLRAAANFDWTEVEPAIFGSLLEGALGADAQWKLGAHYTAEADIMKVVLPTIVEPWRARIDACNTLADVHAALHDLSTYVVLDPACGSGNFLYVAYRELRRIEARLRQLGSEMRRSDGLRQQEAMNVGVSLGNIKGIEIDGFAVELARLTLWIGHKLAVDELDLPERTLPLEDLSGIRRGDALRTTWPAADAIIGNPPFHGSQLIRRVLGDEYAEWLKAEFGVGLKDYCVYWFRKAHDALQPGQRAGLVGTNSISQNRARSASLEYIVGNGGVITSAVSTQPWTGTAKVHVSIVNWVKPANNAPVANRVLLDGVEVPWIDASLRSGDAGELDPTKLTSNASRCFQGPIPIGEGFVLTEKEALEMRDDQSAQYGEVVKPYLIGEDIARRPNRSPSRWIIDFGYMELEEAMLFPDALAIVKERVRPVRLTARRASYRDRWWRFGEGRRGMREAIANLDRFIAGTATGKRLLLEWYPSTVCPSNLTNVFAFEDDYSIGVLMSSAHGSWARRQASTLKGDLRYTPTSAFMTFPWPDSAEASIEEIGRISSALLKLRSDICLERQIGLTTLYNQVDEGAWRDLKALHTQLDEAVIAAYGWPAGISNDPDEICRLLLERNQAIAAGEIAYDPFPPTD